MKIQSGHDFTRGLWRLADPKISLASFSSMFLGACAAGAAAPLDWFWLSLTVVGIFCIEVAKNASGEIFDFDSGVDLAVREEERTPFSGGKRVLVDAVLTREETFWIARVGYALGVGIGLVIATRTPAILPIGIIGVLLAFQYHAPPLKLSYRGLGELAVALCYGPLIAVGTYWVQAQKAPIPFVISTVPLGLLIGAFLWVNEFPDYPADKSAGKKTLVVRLGRARAACCFPVIQAASFALLLFLPAFGVTPWVLLAFLGLFFAVPAAVRLLHRFDDMKALPGIQRLALLTFVIAATMEGVGWILGSRS